MTQKEICFIGTGSGWGATCMGTGKGPDYLFTTPAPYSGSSFSFLSSYSLELKNFHSFPLEMPLFPLNSEGQAIRKKHLLSALHHHYQAVFQALKKGVFPFCIGGDHSLAIATWSAMKKMYPSFGLIWIDAHLDAHTPQTSPSHAVHGMPLAALLGYGDQAFTHMSDQSPILSPSDICVIGARSYEQEEYQLLKNLGVQVYFIEEVHKQGFASIFPQAQQWVTRNTPYYGISLDVDAFDPLEAPGTGARAENGLKEKDVLPSFSSFIQDPHFIAFELVEFNPDLDENQKTLSFLWRLITTVIGEEKC